VAQVRRGTAERETSERRRRGVGAARARALVSVLVALIGALVWAASAGAAQPGEAYESAVRASGPVAYFPFGDASGSKEVKDVVGSYTAENHGMTLGEAGPFGGSKSGFIEHWGSEKRATLPSDPLAGAKEFTAEAWVYWSNKEPIYGEGIFSFTVNGENYIYLTPGAYSGTHRMTFEIHTSSAAASVTASKLKANTWEYVAVTETSSGTMTLYLNGAQVGQTTGATLSPASVEGATEDFLGEAPDLVGVKLSLQGNLSNAAFYTKALSKEQVVEHYDTTKKPINTEAPTITGTAKVGEPLKANKGTWIGSGTISYEYQWQRCEKPGSCKNIEGATGTEYTVSTKDEGYALRVLVTAKDSYGKNEAVSAETAMIGNPPNNTELPSIVGEAREGKTLTVNPGGWSGTGPFSYTYQWEHCEAEGAKTCTEISGATSSSYTAQPGDVGYTLRVKVTAKGKVEPPASATSAATAAVQAAGGAAVVWGENYYGGLGQIYKSSREERPLGIEGLENIVSVADGGSVTLALLGDGELYSWGVNQHGELGDNGYKANWELGKSRVKVDVSGATAIAAYNEHALAIVGSGKESTVDAWGNNQYASQGAGVGGFTDAHVPTAVPGLEGVKAVAAGGGSDYAVMGNGTVQAWGQNSWGELSAEGWPKECSSTSNTIEECEKSPEGSKYICKTETGPELCLKSPHYVVERNEKGEEKRLEHVKKVVASKESAYALLEDGEVVSWGGDHYGTLGQSPNLESGVHHEFEPPAPVMTTVIEGGKEVFKHLEGVKDISTYADHVLALMDNGEVLGWGDNEKGALGKAAETCKASTSGEEWPCFKNAHPIEGLPTGSSGHVEAEAVAAGKDYSLALIGHKVYAWGKNADGELATGAVETSENCTSALEKERNKTKKEEYEKEEKEGKITQKEMESKIEALEREEKKKGACSRVPLLVRERGKEERGNEKVEEEEAGHPPAGNTLEHVSAVAAGQTHALALLETGIKPPAPLVSVKTEKSKETMEKLALNFKWSGLFSRVLYRIYEYPGEDAAEAEEGGGCGESEGKCEELKEGDEGGSGPLYNTGLPKIGHNEELKQGEVASEYRIGHVATAKAGTWTGSKPVKYKFQWQRCSVKGECENTGAPAQECEEAKITECDKYTMIAADYKHTLQVIVTASNECKEEKVKGECAPVAVTSPPTPLVKKETKEEEGRFSTPDDIKFKPSARPEGILIDELEENKQSPVPLEEKVAYEFQLTLGEKILKTVVTPAL